ncbi:MAG: polyamine ABC transporter substrate-binding protein [Proteobacteria bacterium]|nr:polyamine ABC transporter substrate-binding protein [Pseudomonadota bacterium]
MLLLIAGCGGRPQAGTAVGSAPAGAADGPEEKVLNIYNWSDYIAPELVRGFEREFGIKVNYDVYDSNAVLETKLLTGKSGYDIVVPTAAFMAREIPAGVFRTLDPALLPNAKNIDPRIRAQTAPFDPEFAHGVNYLMSTSGIGYNVAQVAAAMPDAPLDSLRMVFDPTVVSHFAKCGVQFIDAPDEVVNTVLFYLGRRPNSEDPADLAAAEQVLMRIRPYVRSIETETYIETLANGDVCLVFGWSGDVGQAAARAREAHNGNSIRYVIPREGAMLYFDLLAIPADAAHWRNAHLFMNYMLRPDVAARNANFLRYATTNAAALPLIEPQLRHDPNIYPPPEVMAKLVPDLPRSQHYTRALTRMWTRFKAGS